MASRTVTATPPVRAISGTPILAIAMLVLKSVTQRLGQAALGFGKDTVNLEP